MILKFDRGHDSSLTFFVFFREERKIPGLLHSRFQSGRSPPNRLVIGSKNRGQIVGTILRGEIIVLLIFFRFSESFADVRRHRSTTYHVHSPTLSIGPRAPFYFRIRSSRRPAAERLACFFLFDSTRGVIHIYVYNMIVRRLSEHLVVSQSFRRVPTVNYVNRSASRFPRHDNNE